MHPRRGSSRRGVMIYDDPQYKIHADRRSPRVEMAPIAAKCSRSTATHIDDYSHRIICGEKHDLTGSKDHNLILDYRLLIVRERFRDINHVKLIVC